MNKESIIVESVYNAYLCDTLDATHAYKIYDQMITEGANTDIRKAHKKCMQEFKKYANEMKKIAKKGDPNDRKAFDEAKKGALKALEKSSDVIETSSSNIGSVICGYIAISMIDMLKWWIPALLTAGIAYIIPKIHEFINLVSGIVKAVNEGDSTMDALNLYKQRYRDYIKLNEKIIDNIEKKYKDNIEKKSNKK